MVLGMDFVGFCMYFLVITANQQFAGIVSFPEIPTPLGNLKFGGHLSGVGGTGFSHYRVFGSYAVVLVTDKGSGRFRDQLGNDRRISGGDLIIVFPDVPHQYGPEPGDTWDEIFIAFDGAAFDGWRSLGLNPNQPVWSIGPVEKWVARISDLLAYPVTSRPGACHAASSVHQLIADALAARTRNETIDWVDTATQALGRGRGAPTLEEIAQSVGFGYETFRKKFKQATGESPGNCRRRMRLTQAALMIQRADLTLDMIAHALDFCDAFHLSKSFKRFHGVCPSSQRRNMKNRI